MAIDNFRRVDFTLDKANDYIIDDQLAKVGDIQGRDLVVQITNAGVIQNQPDIKLTFSWHNKKVDNSGMIDFRPLDSSQGIFIVTFPDAMNNTGNVVATIGINENDRWTFSRNFIIRVEENAFNASVPLESDDWETLLAALEKVNHISELTEAQLKEYLEKSKEEWAAFVEANKEIITAIDPGGTLLKEVVDARRPAGAANAYPTIGARMDEMPTGKEINELKNNLQNIVLVDRHRLAYKGAAVGLTPHVGARVPTADFEFKHLANMGLSATFIVMLNVADKNDPDVQMPDDTIISKAISEATAAGVSVTMIKPHIGVSFMDWLDRATYEPRDWSAFWTNWRKIMLHYAGICDSNRIPILCLGTEQYHCTDESMIEQWGALTAAIRSQYPNLKLTYAALGDEYFNEKHAQIAQYLDFMGANFYPSYTYKMVQPGNAGGITIDELARVFYTADPGRMATGNTRTYHEMVDFYQKKYNVQTFVTETGVMPTDDGLAHLVTDNNFPQASDPTQQTGRFETPALAMEAFFNGIAQNPNIIGFNWWGVGYPFHFFNELGDSVAEDVMKKYVKGGLI